MTSEARTHTQCAWAACGINAIFIHSTTNENRHLMKSGRAACRPIEGEEIPTYKDFWFKIFTINALFFHSTTNGYRHLMKSGRAACRPIFRKIVTGMNRSILILPGVSWFSIQMVSAQCILSHVRRL